MFLDRRLKVEKLIEDKKYKQKYRKYLGISIIGEECPRKLFYIFRFYLPPEEITARQNRLFNRGHKEEPIILADLKKIGCKIVSTQKEATACHGHIKGHLDAEIINVPDAPKTPHLGEFKTSSIKYFNQLEKSRSVQKTFKKHYDQCQGYMHKFKLKRCLYICVCKNDDRRYYERVKYNKEYAIILFERAESIIISKIPPIKISDSPTHYLCHENFCRYRDICHFPNSRDTKINKTCRNCLYVEIHDKARWKCKIKNKFLSFKKQQKRCKKWTIL